MKSTALDVQHYFAPILGKAPWRARLGVGSFLTFDFGPRLPLDRHRVGTWRLWIYQSHWILKHNGREVANADGERRHIDLAISRLEQTELTNVVVDADLVTTFVFSDFKLMVKPADYLETTEDRDYYWLFFMPDNQVLRVGPGGVNLGRSDQI